jgi:hypothetical protein
VPSLLEGTPNLPVDRLFKAKRLILLGFVSQNLILIKYRRARLSDSFLMGTRMPPTDVAREAADLLSLALWYRSWAAVADSEQEKERRLVVAA